MTSDRPSDDPQPGPEIRAYQVIRATWLSRKPGREAFPAAVYSVLAVAMGSVMAWRNFHGAAEWMPASREAVFMRGELWRLWTTTLVHADLGHLLSNGFLLFVLGYFLTGYFGLRVFPLMAVVMAGAIHAGALLTYRPEVRLVGASGVVFWMGGAWLILYFFLNRQKSLGQRALRALGVGLMLFAPSQAFDPDISYRTHAVGFGLGLLWGLVYYLLHRRTFRAAEVVETVQDVE
ncbi:MAG: rhomboid family intramembrane serine protease [Bdellovibrionales bacterium]